MASRVDSRIDWRHWRDRWEAQQAAYTVDWEDRFTIMLDALDALLPEDFVAIDRASGPGTTSRRLLERFPRARSVWPARVTGSPLRVFATDCKKRHAGGGRTFECAGRFTSV